MLPELRGWREMGAVGTATGSLDELALRRAGSIARSNGGVWPQGAIIAAIGFPSPCDPIVLVGSIERFRAPVWSREWRKLGNGWERHVRFGLCQAVWDAWARMDSSVRRGRRWVDP